MRLVCLSTIVKHNTAAAGGFADDIAHVVIRAKVGRPAMRAAQ